MSAGASAGYQPERIPQERVVETCALCRQTRVFFGDFAIEKAQMWLEDGGHFCIDIVEDEGDSLLPYFSPEDGRDEWSM